MSKWDFETCKTKNLTTDGPEQFVNSLNGTEKDMKDVHGFSVEGAQCQYFPRMIDSFLPNLRAIRFQDTKLKHLSKFDIEPFPELVTFVLIRNQLEFLDGDLFDYNTKIKSLTLNETNILIINGAILMHLKQLSVIEFELQRINNCTGICRDKRCIEKTIATFNQNCEFDSIYPRFKTTAKAIQKIGDKCKKNEKLNAFCKVRH